MGQLNFKGRTEESGTGREVKCHPVQPLILHEDTETPRDEGKGVSGGNRAWFSACVLAVPAICIHFLCCITNNHKLSGLKQHIYYLTMSVVQKPERVWMLRVSQGQNQGAGQSGLFSRALRKNPFARPSKI